MTTFLTTPKPQVFDWRLWPETQSQIDAWVASALAGSAFAARLATRMREESNTRFSDWVDHLVLTDQPGLTSTLKSLGYVRQLTPYATGAPAYAHDGGMFPRLAVVAAGSNRAEVKEVAIQVESVAAFSRAHDLGWEPQGYALGPYRVARLRGDGESSSFAAVERRGYLGFEPYDGQLAREGRMRPHAARDALAARDLWLGRKRSFEDDAEGFDVTERLLERVIDMAGARDLACHLVFEVERAYWQSRNRAAGVQKARQDRLGLGWANHDHHTFRCSRRFFPHMTRMFESLGFRLRERFHAGAHAGWGAQIFENPTTGIVIFADLDLAPEEAADDFAHHSLPDLPRPNTVGLWVGLHGESILDAGMHHLEAQFDFDGLRDGLKNEAGVTTMAPFSDFPFLRQAFTEGERWSVSKHRADRVLAQGWIDAEQHAKFLREGAIGSHLENLQRRDGYKGFNQQSVSAILKAVDPRLH
jgi:hypothetical protein